MEPSFQKSWQERCHQILAELSFICIFLVPNFASATRRIGSSLRALGTTDPRSVHFDWSSWTTIGPTVFRKWGVANGPMGRQQIRSDEEFEPSTFTNQKRWSARRGREQASRADAQLTRRRLCEGFAWEGKKHEMQTHGDALRAEGRQRIQQAL